MLLKLEGDTSCNRKKKQCLDTTDKRCYVQLGHLDNSCFDGVVCVTCGFWNDHSFFFNSYSFCLEKSDPWPANFMLLHHVSFSPCCEDLETNRLYRADTAKQEIALDLAGLFLAVKTSFCLCKRKFSKSASVWFANAHRQFPFPLTVPNGYCFSHRGNSFCSHAARCPVLKSTCCVTQCCFLSCSFALSNYFDVGCSCIWAAVVFVACHEDILREDT